MTIKNDKKNFLQNTDMRVRNHIHGTAQRPRLNVFRSLAHIYVQIIDDDKQVTLTAASSEDKFFKFFICPFETAASLVGTSIAKKALAAGITEVVIDCPLDLIYNDRIIRTLLTAARDAGLQMFVRLNNNDRK